MNIEQVQVFVLPWTAQDDDYLLYYSYVIIYIYIDIDYCIYTACFIMYMYIDSQIHIIYLSISCPKDPYPFLE